MRALSRPKFQLVMLGWLCLLSFVFFFPAPQGFNIDIHVYTNGLSTMLAGEPAYLVPDPVATAISDGRPIYFFPPPFAAIAGGSVGLLPAGEMLWLLVNIAVVGLAFALMRRATPPNREFQAVVPGKLRLILPLVAWFLFVPTFQQIFYGNQQGMILLGAVLMVVGLTTERPPWTGLGLGSAILLKASPVLFVLPLLVQRRYAHVAWTTAVCVAGAVITTAIVGVKPWLDFANALVVGSNLVGTQGYNMAPLARMFPNLPAIVLIAATGVAMAAAGRLPVRQMLVVSISIYLLGWPNQWIHYAEIALPAMALLLPDRRTWLVLAIAYVLFQFFWWMAWLPACLLLILAALKPDWTGHLQAIVGRAIGAVPTPAGPPAPAAPPGPALPG